MEEGEKSKSKGKSKKSNNKNYTFANKKNLKQRCYIFSLAVLKMSDTLPSKRSAWVLQDQVLRSSTSIGANIVEARAASSRKEFARYYDIALKSANETVYWLALLRDSKLVTAAIITPLLSEAQQLAKIIAASIIRLRRG